MDRGLGVVRQVLRFTFHVSRFVFTLGAAVLLSLTLSLAAVIIHLVPGAAECLQFERAAITDGQVWRVLSGHWTHYSLSHLGWVCAAFSGLGVLCENSGRRRFLVCVSLSALAIPTAVWFFAPEVTELRGLSGIASALFALLAVQTFRHSLRNGQKAWCVLVAVASMAFLAKIGLEATGNSLLVDQAAAGMVPVPLCHLAGAVVGVVVGVAGSLGCRAECPRPSTPPFPRRRGPRFARRLPRRRGGVVGWPSWPSLRPKAPGLPAGEVGLKAQPTPGTQLPGRSISMATDPPPKGGALGLAIRVTLAALFTCAPAQAEAPILRIEPNGHTALVKWLGFTPDGKQLLSAGDDKVVRVWDVSDPAHPRLSRSLRFQIGDGREGAIYSAALSSSTLAVAGHPHQAEKSGFPVVLLDTATGEVRGLLRGHTRDVVSVSMSSDGRWLASGSLDKTVRIWRLRPAGEGGELGPATTEQHCTVLRGHGDGVLSVAFVPGSDPRRLVSGSLDGTMRLWQQRGTTWRPLRIIRGRSKHYLRAVCSPDGRFIASTSPDHAVLLWNSRTGELMHTLGRHDDSVFALAFAPGGRSLVSGGGGVGLRDQSCRVWQVPDGRPVARLTKHDNTVLCAAISPDGTLAATAGGNNQEIYLWDPRTGEPRGHIVGTGRSVWAVAFSPDGQRVAFGNANNSDTIRSAQPLERTFDLSEMALGPEVQEGETWLRGDLVLDGLSARRTQRNVLVISSESRETAQICREQPYDTVRCYTFIPGERDGTRIAVGSNSSLTLHDAATGEKLRSFVGHTGYVWSVAVSPDGRFLVSGAWDQTFRLWRTGTGELLLSVFAGADGEWVAWTPQGYYKSSPGGDRLIGWHLNQGEGRTPRFFYAWQFRRQFERPDLLEQILSAGSVERAREAAGADLRRRPRERVTVADLARLAPPSITILQPQEGVTTSADGIRLQATVRTAGELPAEATSVKVNGRPVLGAGTRGVSVRPRAESLTIDSVVPLTVGMNEITVLASSSSATGKAVVRVTREAGTTPKPNLYVLAIGISDYSEQTLKLDYAAADADAVTEAFREQQGGLFQSVQTRLLADGDATRRSIVRGLRWLDRSATQRDLALVFLSGHGKRDEKGNYFFVPSDFVSDELWASGIRWTEIANSLAGLPCKVLLAMDTCHSGALVGRKARGLDLTSAIRELTSPERGVVVMAASTGREVSQERREWGHGAFTLALLEAISGRRLCQAKSATPLSADLNRDGLIHLVELDAYITNRVKELTDGAQHPMTHRGDVPSFPVAQVR